MQQPTMEGTQQPFPFLKKVESSVKVVAEKVETKFNEVKPYLPEPMQKTSNLKYYVLFALSLVLIGVLIAKKENVAPNGGHLLRCLGLSAVTF